MTNLEAAEQLQNREYFEALELAIDALRASSQWISIEDRLPPIDERVLVFAGAKMDLEEPEEGKI